MPVLWREHVLTGRNGSPAAEVAFALQFLR
jgi:hypothetical protein